MKRGSIALARELCVQIAGYTDDDQDQCGHDYGSVDIAEILSAEVVRLQKALAQPEQEPLEYWNAVEGWVKIDEVRQHFDSVGCGTIYKTAGEGREPLYTTPPQRPWVGLTEEDWGWVANKKGTSLDTFDQGAAWAQQRLKERNK